MSEEIPDIQRSNKCRSCGAPILWAETVKGKSMPIDPTPVPDGNIFLQVRQHLPPLAIYLTALELTAAQAEKRELFKSHFATCPEATKWRKNK